MNYEKRYGNTSNAEKEELEGGVVDSLKVGFGCSALFGFGLGIAAKLMSCNYEPGAAATASAVLSLPFLSSERNAISKYIGVNAGLNAGYNAAYAATEAVMKLFMQ